MQLARVDLWEAGRKLLVDGDRVLVFSLSGSVFSVRRDESGLEGERQKSVLETCPAYLRADFTAFRKSLNVVRSTQTDLDLLKKCSGQQ